MSDMQVTVGLRRETGVDCIVHALCQILLYGLLNKIFARSLVFHNASSFLLVF